MISLTNVEYSFVDFLIVESSTLVSLKRYEVSLDCRIGLPNLGIEGLFLTFGHQQECAGNGIMLRFQDVPPSEVFAAQSKRVGRVNLIISPYLFGVIFSTQTLVRSLSTGRVITPPSPLDR